MNVTWYLLGFAFGCLLLQDVSLGLIFGLLFGVIGSSFESNDSEY